MPQCNKLNGEWDFIVLKEKSILVYLALGQTLQLLWMKIRFLLIGSNEDASCRRAGEGFSSACAINQRVGRNLWCVGFVWKKGHVV